MDKGWISIHRKIINNPILKMNKSYSKFEAWIWLLLRATYSDQKVVLGADIYKLKSGEILTSQKKLCKQFKWGNSRLRTFLQLLEKDVMIKVKTNSKLTMITILNYNKLQKNQIATKSQSNYNQIHINKDNKTNKDISQRESDFRLKASELIRGDGVDEFLNYWTESNISGKKMRFEMQQTFDVNRRFTTWINNSKKWDKDKQFKSLDDKFPFDKTGNSRLGKCSKCNGIVFLDKFKPMLDSTCCNAKVIGKGE